MVQRVRVAQLGARFSRFMGSAWVRFEATVGRRCFI
jgi:hypothetical protein